MIASSHISDAQCGNTNVKWSMKAHLPTAYYLCNKHTYVHIYVNTYMYTN